MATRRTGRALAEPRPKRCELCIERGVSRPPIAVYEVERAPEPGVLELAWESYIVCEDCADDIVEGAIEDGVEFCLIGYVPMGARL